MQKETTRGSYLYCVQYAFNALSLHYQKYTYFTALLLTRWTLCTRCCPVFAFIHKAYSIKCARSVGNERCARSSIYSIDIANGKILFAAQTQSVYCVTLRESLYGRQINPIRSFLPASRKTHNFRSVIVATLRVYACNCDRCKFH